MHHHYELKATLNPAFPFSINHQQFLQPHLIVQSFYLPLYPTNTTQKSNQESYIDKKFLKFFKTCLGLVMWCHKFFSCFECFKVVVASFQVLVVFLFCMFCSWLNPLSMFIVGSCRLSFYYNFLLLINYCCSSLFYFCNIFMFFFIFGFFLKKKKTTIGINVSTLKGSVVFRLSSQP